MEKKSTYTYTARSAQDSSKVVTFTLRGDRMTVDMAALFEQVDRAIQARKETPEGAEAEAGIWLQPVAVSLAERFTAPFHIGDVVVHVDGSSLSVVAWARAKGLRLAPIAFVLREVDNPDAAHAFAAEVDKRIAQFGRPGALPGPFDYWATWVAAGFALVAGVAVWLLTRKREQD